MCLCTSKGFGPVNYLDKVDSIECDDPVYVNPRVRDLNVPSRTLHNLFREVAWDNHELNVLGYLEKDTRTRSTYYAWKNYKELEMEADHLANSMVKGNFCPTVTEGGREMRMIGIWAQNSESWWTTMLAAISQNISVVPIHETQGNGLFQYILHHTGLKTVACTQDKVRTILNMVRQQKTHNLKVIVQFGQVDENQFYEAKDFGIRLYGLEDLIAYGSSFPAPPNAPSPEDIYLIEYTSGSTGLPRAAMISHQNVIAMMEMLKQTTTVYSTDVYYSALPLSHTYEQIMAHYILSVGGRIGFSSGRPQRMREEIQLLKPTILATVPKVLTK
eukprot:CAMPEP_0114986696 /NCGR_PEP_ID=MMETSP0216-20121206/8571_1 /TAXON_ID=223996 /ORGANISM="Protocruzia adherens, Strain Boccale" /LENGTH=329 /DNA_ID=CAMNT_0002349163 /DNA_START=135 /DNA_END=1121 /DNA_ORIENTATION=-